MKFGVHEQNARLSDIAHAYLDHVLTPFRPWLVGGKERMTHYFSTRPDEEPFATMFPEDDEARKDFIKSLHLRKTDLFLDVVQAGNLPLRPGVRRLVKEALDNGAKVAVCSTSNEKAVKVRGEREGR